MIDTILDYVKKNDISTEAIRDLFGVEPDRLNNGGPREVLELLIREGDDPEWIFEEIQGEL